MTGARALLVILDGWGLAPAWGGNPLSEAHLPFINTLMKQPYATLAAAGASVGFQGTTRGNSEVGHLNLGAGRIVLQESTRLSHAIADQTFLENPTLLTAYKKVNKIGGRLHLMGLLSETSVHADREHLYALLRLAKKAGVSDVRLHLFTDGRDSDPRDALRRVVELENKLTELGVGKIQTLCGRYWAMDRDKHWDRTKRAYELIAFGKGKVTASAKEAVSSAYSDHLTDEFIEPTVVQKDTPYAGLTATDTVIFWNFRADRARQLTAALTDQAVTPFTESLASPIQFLTLVSYGAGEELPGVQVAFPSKPVTDSLASVVAGHGLRQFHIAETEKYAHVTYFFNGRVEKPFSSEERVLIPSPNVATYDLLPAMSAEKITKKLVTAIKQNKIQFLVANYANADMVGHTGNYQAIIKAVETIDRELAILAKVCLDNRVSLVITADHGNAEQKINPETGELSTNHTSNPVPCYFWLNQPYQLSHNPGLLADVAPTILALLGLPKPDAMTGQSLLQDHL